MPEPTTPPTPAAVAPSPEPAFSLADLQKTIGDTVKEQMEQYNRPAPEPEIMRPTATENPLKAVISPIIEPEMNRLRLMAEGAQDAAVFYGTNPEAIKYKDQIETNFKALMQNGTPFNREALLKYVMGHPENIKKMVDDGIAAEKKKIADAAAAETLEGGFRPSGGQVKDAFTATDEELDKALQGMSF
jgi:hypothetical protein